MTAASLADLSAAVRRAQLARQRSAAAALPASEFQPPFEHGGGSSSSHTTPSRSLSFYSCSLSHSHSHSYSHSYSHSHSQYTDATGPCCPAEHPPPITSEQGPAEQRSQSALHPPHARQPQSTSLSSSLSFHTVSAPAASSSAVPLSACSSPDPQGLQPKHISSSSTTSLAPPATSTPHISAAPSPLTPLLSSQKTPTEVEFGHSSSDDPPNGAFLDPPQLEVSFYGLGIKTNVSPDKTLFLAPALPDKEVAPGLSSEPLSSPRNEDNAIVPSSPSKKLTATSAPCQSPKGKEKSDFAGHKGEVAELKFSNYESFGQRLSKPLMCVPQRDILPGCRGKEGNGSSQLERNLAATSESGPTEAATCNSLDKSSDYLEDHPVRSSKKSPPTPPPSAWKSATRQRRRGSSAFVTLSRQLPTLTSECVFANTHAAPASEPSEEDSSTTSRPSVRMKYANTGETTDQDDPLLQHANSQTASLPATAVSAIGVQGTSSDSETVIRLPSTTFRGRPDLQFPASSGTHLAPHYKLLPSSLRKPTFNTVKVLTSYKQAGRKPLVAGHIKSSNPDSQVDESAFAKEVSHQGVDAEALVEEKPPLDFAKHSLFDHKLRPLLRPLFRGFLPFIAILSIVVIWGIIPIYWGSLYKLTSRKLVGYIINGDLPDNQIGRTFEDAVLASVNKSNPERLHWQSRPRSMFSNDDSIRKALRIDQEAWIIVQIMDNATDALAEAQLTGNQNWNASQVVTVWYSTARNYQAVLSSIVEPTKAILVPSMNALNSNITATWAERVTSMSNDVDIQNYFTMGRRAPQTIGHAVDFTARDVNPFDQTVTVATTFIGLIYLLLLAFNITMALFGSRQQIVPFLKFKHLLILRVLVPLASNALVSLLFCLVNLAFHVSFRSFGAGGFFAFLGLMCTGINVLGLSTEMALSLLGPKFVAFGLLFLVVINVSGCHYPIPMLNQFYRVSYAMPFYHLRRASLVLLYAQGRGVDILTSWAVLAAWWVALLAVFPFCVWTEQNQAVKTRKEAETCSDAKD